MCRPVDRSSLFRCNTYDTSGKLIPGRKAGLGRSSNPVERDDFSSMIIAASGELNSGLFLISSNYHHGFRTRSARRRVNDE